MKTFLLEIVTPERKVYSDHVELLVAKAVTGEIGIMANHAPIVVSLTIGPLRLKKDGAEFQIAIMSGFMEVTKEKVVILAEVAEVADEIDIDRAMRAKARAEERIKQKQDNVDFGRAELALQRAATRIKVGNSQG